MGLKTQISFNLQKYVKKTLQRLIMSVQQNTKTR